jgi:RND family efflux transporter MFP subunit
MRKISARQFVVLASVAAVLFMGVVLAGRSARRPAAAPAGATEPVAVSIAQATMTGVTSAIESGGVVQARATATIAARILAPIREIRVSPGDRVYAGQTIVVLDGQDLAAASRGARSATLAAEHGSSAASAELQAAGASLALARVSYARIVDLQARRSATAQELDEATAALRSAEARVDGASARALQAAAAVDSARAAGDQARTIESFTAITAPFDGIVTEKMVDPGNMASPGMPLLRLEDTRAFRLEVRVDESQTSHIRDGDKVPIFLGTQTIPITGTVAEISRAVDVDARSFLVKVALPDAGGLRSGQFGKARFDGVPRRALTIPPSAIVRRGQITSVFVIDQGVARLRFVNLSGTEVLAGLTQAEVVILSPPPVLSDGSRVSVGGR